MFKRYEMDFESFRCIGRDKEESILLEGVITMHRTKEDLIATQHNFHACSVTQHRFHVYLEFQ